MAEIEETVIALDTISEHSTLTLPKKDSTLSSRTESVTRKPKIPDGGWGWVVVLSSLVISLIQDGISFSFGILQPQFVNHFRSSESASAWIGGLFLATPLLSGPFMSALVDKYGCRPMTIVGALVSTTGFLLSYFAKSIELMYLTFGIISGLGLGLTYITAVVSIAFWFDKKRNLAVGLGACGTGIGTFVYAPLTDKLIEVYGWRGTIVILAGTLLNMCVCGAVMRDPDWIIEQNNKQNSKLSSKSSSLCDVSTPSLKMNIDDVRNLLKSGEDAEYVLQTLATSIEREEEGPKSDHHQSVLNLPTFIKQNEKVPVEVLEHLSENKNLYKVIVQNYPTLLHSRSTSEKGLNKLVEDPSLLNRIPVTLSVKLKKSQKPKTVTHQYSLPEASQPFVSPEKKPKLAKNLDTTWLVKQFSTTTTSHQNYFKNMRFPRHSLTHRGVVLNKNKYKLRASSCPNIYKVSMTTLAKDDDEQWYSTVLNTVSLFFEFHFLLLSLSTILLYAWFMTPYIFIVTHLEDLGYSTDKASLVISVIGVANTLGMIGLGWAGDQPWTNVTKAYGVCLILCGFCCSAMYIFSMNYVVLNIFGVLFGVFLASNFSFSPVMLVELLPLDSFTKAYGLQLLCEGIGHLGGPPLAGLLKDITDTWSYSFHLAGVFIALSGVLVLIIPYTKNRKLVGSGPLEKDLESE